jgi:hypothetical protein
MIFSCPHFDPEGEHCRLLKTDCVPGRRGCVLGSKAVFAVPVEERLRARGEENRRREFERLFGPTRNFGAETD